MFEIPLGPSNNHPAVSAVELFHSLSFKLAGLVLGRGRHFIVNVSLYKEKKAVLHSTER